MEPRSHIGMMLVVTGLVIAAIGIVVMFAGRIPFLGRLPGDFSFQGRGWSVHIPLATGLVLSLILTIILNLFFRR